MKRHLISSAVALVVMAAALAAFGQQSETRQSERRQRIAGGRFLQAQTRAVETIQEQAAKLKTAFEESARPGKSIRSRQDLSQEERAKFGEEARKMFEKRDEIIEVIEQQVLKLQKLGFSVGGQRRWNSRRQRLSFPSQPDVA